MLIPIHNPSIFSTTGNNTEIDLKYVVERMADLTEAQYQQKVIHLKAVRKYFTYPGKVSFFSLLLLLLLLLFPFFGCCPTGIFYIRYPHFFSTACQPCISSSLLIWCTDFFLLSSLHDTSIHITHQVCLNKLKCSWMILLVHKEVNYDVQHILRQKDVAVDTISPGIFHHSPTLVGRNVWGKLTMWNWNSTMSYSWTPYWHNGSRRCTNDRMGTKTNTNPVKLAHIVAMHTNQQDIPNDA